MSDDNYELHEAARQYHMSQPPGTDFIDAVCAFKAGADWRSRQAGDSGCTLCANGNDLPDGEYCRACGKEKNLSKLGKAVKTARGSQNPPESPVMLAASAPSDPNSPDLEDGRPDIARKTDEQL